MALACDLTRVFSLLFSTAGCGTVFWNVGATNGLHQINHDERGTKPSRRNTQTAIISRMPALTPSTMV